MTHETRAGASAGRAFALVCVVWILVSAVVPALPVWESITLSAIIFSTAISGVVWLGIVLWATVPAAAAMIAGYRIVERRYASAARWSLVPASGCLLYLFATDVGEIARFHLNRASYERVVADAEAGRCTTADRAQWGVHIDDIDCGKPITVIFIWGGWVSMWHGIVYDAADEIAKPATERSQAWKSRPIGSLLSCSGGAALGGHYYRSGGSYTGGTADCG